MPNAFSTSRFLHDNRAWNCGDLSRLWKFGIFSVAILSNSGLGISFLLHVSKQWDSSSITPQFSHILSCKGIFGDSCLPVSMFRLWEITLNLAILLYVFLGRFYTVWFKILSIYIRETCVFIDMYMCLFSPGLSCIFIFYILLMYDK